MGSVNAGWLPHHRDAPLMSVIATSIAVKPLVGGRTPYTDLEREPDDRQGQLV